MNRDPRRPCASVAATEAAVSLSVAIIEPDTNVASTVEQAFTSLGFQAHVLADGDVVDFVRQRTPSVILLNVELPRGSGYSFCNRLKKQADLKRIPIILTSGMETEEAFAQHQKSATHADAYIHKPFSVDQLLDQVSRLVPEAFPNGKPAAPADVAAIGIPAAPDPPPADTGNVFASGEGAAVMPEPDAPPPRPKAAPPLPPKRTEGAGPQRTGRPAVPSLDELLAQGRGEAPPQPPPGAAGPEAKLTFLRESLRQKEGDLGRARELWTQRDRETSQLQELLELRERELERARKAREDLLEQLTATEDQLASSRLDMELNVERTERLEREKKALADELENLSNELERNIVQLQTKNSLLDDGLRGEQAARAAENERSAAEIDELVKDLDKARADFAKRESELLEADARARSHAADLQARIAGLEVDGQTLRGKLGDAQRDGETLRRELTQLRQDKAADDERARTVVEDLEGRVRDLSLDKDGLEAELARTQATLNEAHSKIEDGATRVTDLEADLADTQGRLTDATSQLEASETRAAELAHELSEVQRHALELSQEKHRLDNRLADMQKSLAVAEARGAELAADLDDTKQRALAHAREQDARIGSYKENIAELEDRAREAADAYAQLEVQLKDTGTRLEEKHRDWDQERINRQKDVLKRDQRIGDLEQRVRELDAAVHETERAGKAREAELSHELDLQRARGDELDRDLNRARAKGEEQAGLLENAKGRLVDLTREYKRAEARITQLSEELQAAADRNAQVTRELHEARERNTFIEAELGEERANRAQDVQSRDAAMDRTNQQAKERIDKLQDSVQRLKAELGTAQAETQTVRALQQRADERARQLETQIDREARERQAIADRNSILDGEVEGAQARAEQLQDEITRLKTSLKRAQDEALAAKKERAGLEERYRQEEQTMVKRLEEVKASAMEVRAGAQGDIEKVTRERDEARAQALEIRRKAEIAVRKYKEVEAQLQAAGSGADARVQKLADELRAEKEARAREAAQYRAQEERLQGELATVQTQSAQVSEVELTSLKAQVKERDDKLVKFQTEYTSLREKAQKAIAQAKAFEEKARATASGGEAELKGRVEQLTGKYNEAVQKLKQQAELNKKIDAAYKELAEKHRKALTMLKEHRDAAASESTQIIRPTEG